MQSGQTCSKVSVFSDFQANLWGLEEIAAVKEGAFTRHHYSFYPLQSC